MTEFISKSRDYLGSFISECCSRNLVPYIKKGILNIEAFYWWSMVGYFKPDVILESGVARGRSTEILARAQRFFGIPVHYAFDIDNKYEAYVKNRLRGYNTIYQIRDSLDGFKDVLNKHKGDKVVVIIDGPKSESPFAKLIKYASLLSNLCSIGCHDCHPKGKMATIFLSSCSKYLPSKSAVITNEKLNMDIKHLNDCLKECMSKELDDKKQSELFYYSNFVGITT